MKKIILIPLLILTFACSSKKNTWPRVQVFDGYAVVEEDTIFNDNFMPRCISCYKTARINDNGIYLENLYIEIQKKYSTKSIFNKLEMPKAFSYLEQNLQLLWIVNNVSIKQEYQNRLLTLEETKFWNIFLSKCKPSNEWTDGDYSSFWKKFISIEWGGDSSRAIVINPANKGRFDHYYMDAFSAENYFYISRNDKIELLYGTYLLNKLLIEEAMDSKAENILYVSYYNHKNKDSTLLSTFGNLIFKYTLYKDGNSMKLQKKLLNYYQLMVSKR